MGSGDVPKLDISYFNFASQLESSAALPLSASPQSIKHNPFAEEQPPTLPTESFSGAKTVQSHVNDKSI